MSFKNFSWYGVPKRLDGNPTFFSAFNDEGTGFGREIYYDGDNQSNNLREARRFDRGGVSCVGDICHAWDTGSTQQVRNGIKQADSFMFPSNQVTLIRGATNQGGGYTNKYSSFFTNLDVPYIYLPDGQTHKSDSLDQAVWAPMADAATIAYNCCVGNISDSNFCGPYALDNNKFNTKCLPFYETYCDSRSIYQNDPNSNPISREFANAMATKPIPKEKGCWYVDASPYITAEQKDKAAALNNLKWTLDSKPTTATQCIAPKLKELSEKNLDAAVKVGNPTIGGYVPSPVVWVDETGTNNDPWVMNQSTTTFDRRICACSVRARESESNATKKLMEKLDLNGQQTAALSNNPLCYSMNCGKVGLGVPFSDTQVRGSITCPNVNLTNVNCTQKLDEDMKNSAIAAGISVTQECLANSGGGGGGGGDSKKVLFAVSVPIDMSKMTAEQQQTALNNADTLIKKYILEKTQYKVSPLRVDSKGNTISYSALPTLDISESFLTQLAQSPELQTILKQSTSSKSKMIIIIVIIAVVVILLTVMAVVFLKKKRPPMPQYGGNTDFTSCR